ncbi:MAG: polysaccharide export protein [Chitinophagaceae bacterium]|nr:MAG: polysaccharide export protein [Chitinophagaceae bacterium]
MRQFVSAFVLGLFVVVMAASCTSTQKVTYFSGTEKGDFNATGTIPESIIQKSDILNITVTSLNPEASIIFNPPIANNMAANAVLPGQNSSAPGSNLGYLVNTDGVIQFPILGNLKAEGLTKNQLRDQIAKEIQARQLLKDPIVTIRFLNFRVTVLGEVARPNVITVPNEKITMLEAIGLAGDLTLYGKRENVMLIRESESKRSVMRINLNNAELFTSPYYYLQSGDIIYVEPNKARVAATTQTRQNLPILISAAGLIATVISIVVR